VALTMDQVPALFGKYPAQSGLGYAQVVSAILGPLVTGGADIYRTSQESKISKDELKQRRREFEAQAQLAQETLEAQERAQLIATHVTLQQKAASQAWWSQNMPMIVGGVVLLGLGIAVASSGKGK